MKRNNILRLSALVLFLGCLFCFPAFAQINSFQFNQVDYYNDGLLVSPHSPWGEVEVSFVNSSSDPQWLNIVGITGGLGWIVQNLPLMPTENTSSTASAFFNLGVPAGTNVTGNYFAYYYTVTDAPLPSAPVSGTSGNGSIGSSQHIVNTGVPSGVTTLPAPANLNLNWSAPFVNVQQTLRAGVPNVVQEKNWCGPGAAANSISWLASNNGFTTGQTLLQSQTELAGLMFNNHDGNWDGPEASALLQYINAHKLPLAVQYVVVGPTPQYIGREILPLVGSLVTANGSAVDDGPFLWAWIQSELQAGKDVELMTARHWVVVEGIISWNGNYLIEYRDDPYQHGTATTALEQQKIANRHVWTYGTTDALGNPFTNIAGIDEQALAAVAESPTWDLAPPKLAAFIGQDIGNTQIGVSFTATRNFAIQSAGIKSNPFGNATGQPKTWEIDVFIYQAGARTRGALLATGSLCVGGLCPQTNLIPTNGNSNTVVFYDVPINFTFQAGQTYLVAFGVRPDGWGTGTTAKNSVEFFNFDPGLPNFPPYESGAAFTIGPVTVLDGAFGADFYNKNLPHIRLKPQ